MCQTRHSAGVCALTDILCEQYMDGELVGRSTEEEGDNEPAALPGGTVPTLQLQDGAAGEEPAGDGSVTSLVVRELGARYLSPRFIVLTGRSLNARVWGSDS